MRNLDYETFGPFDARASLKSLKEWVHNFVTNAGKQNVVIGISGGKDSTICAALLAKTLGPKHVFGVLMPNGVQSDIDDAERVIAITKINRIYMPITDAYNAMSKSLEAADAKGISDLPGYKTNCPSRLRMVVLYSLATKYNALVCNTGNFDEEYVGYTTIYGDDAGDFSPFGKLTISEEREIGLKLGLPKELVFKTPSDGMSGCSDEDKLGVKYSDIEALIYAQNALIYSGLTLEVGEKLIKLRNGSKFKRNLIQIPSYDPYMRRA